MSFAFSKTARIFLILLSLVLCFKVYGSEIGLKGSCSSLFLKRNSLLIQRVDAQKLLLDAAELTFPRFWNQTVVQSNRTFSSKNSELSDWVMAHFFFDRSEILQSSSPESSEITKLWEEKEEGAFFGLFGTISKYPFDNFKELFEKEILVNVPKTYDPTPADIKRFHAALMKAPKKAKTNIENMMDSELGQFRANEVFYYADSRRIDEEKVVVKKNELLFFEERSLSTSRIFYPSLDHIKQFKERLSPSLLSRIAQANGSERDKYTSLMVEELVNSAFANYSVRLSKTQDILQRVIEHSNLVYDLISIHPFSNGNGRTLYFLLMKLLASEGLPPAYFRKAAKDIELSRNEFSSKVLDGVVAAIRFLTDIENRSGVGLSPFGSVVPYLGFFPDHIVSSWDENTNEIFHLNEYDFVSSIRRKKTSLKNENEILRTYVKDVKKRSIVYKDSKNRRDEFQISYIPEEFGALFLKNVSDSSKLWSWKINEYYTDALLHRGLSMQNTLSTEELLSYFVDTKSATASMNSAKIGDEARFKKSILADLDHWNALIEEPKKMVRLVTDHMKAEGGYDSSIFTSTSKLRSTAERFSKGFMMDESSILGMKGEIIVSFIEPRFGTVDLNRFKKIAQSSSDTDFASQYPRQQEVLVAGGVSPDSVMELEFRDVSVKSVQNNSGQMISGVTEVSRTRRFSRNVNNPDEVFYTEYSGDVEKNEIVLKKSFFLSKLGQ